MVVPYPDEDVTLSYDSTGSDYLHLILPADRINYLNGSTRFLKG